jgi:prevent-host-death family protein
MKMVTISAAKTNLSPLVDEAAAGEEIVITKSGKPVARLTPIPKFDRKPGRLKGVIHMRDNFDDPLPPEIAAAFRIER